MHDNNGDEEESFSPGSSAAPSSDEEVNIITEPCDPVPRNPTPLHVLARRPPAPWGRRSDVEATVTLATNVDFITDLTEVGDMNTTQLFPIIIFPIMYRCKTFGGVTWSRRMDVVLQHSGLCTPAFWTNLCHVRIRSSKL